MGIRVAGLPWADQQTKVMPTILCVVWNVVISSTRILSKMEQNKLGLGE